MATRIISRITQRLGADLPVKALFECPTVAEMALIIEQNRDRIVVRQMEHTQEKLQAISEDKAKREVERAGLSAGGGPHE
jgi:hypothetical protein